MSRCDFPIRSAKRDELLGYDGNNVLVDIYHKYSCRGTGNDEVMSLTKWFIVE